MSGVFGQQGPTTTDDEYNTLAFVFQMLMQQVQTCTLVEIVSCTNDGGVSPVGRVTVKPCVNQMTGNRQSVPHGTIYNLLYSRISGGANAIIIDPEPGDIGLMAFCSRDISGVVANEGPANPGSFRTFDWADGIYTMGVPLGVTPTQYVQVSAVGINIKSPTQITLDAPTVNIGRNGTVNIGDGHTTIDSRVFLQHMHSAGTYVAGATPVTDDSGQVI